MRTRIQTSISFVLGMIFREIRASWARLAFFFVCVAIGVGAIVGVRSIIQSARATLLHESRTLLAADVLVQSREPWTTAGRSLVETRLNTVPVLERIESVETTTMVRPADPAKAVAKMVELRRVASHFTVNCSWLAASSSCLRCSTTTGHWCGRSSSRS